MMEEENSCVGPSRRFKIPVSATIPIFQHFLSRTPSRMLKNSVGVLRRSQGRTERF